MIEHCITIIGMSFMLVLYSTGLQLEHSTHESSTALKVTRVAKNDGNPEKLKRPTEEIYESIKDIVSASMSSDYQTTTLSKIEAAEMMGCCVIDFQI